MRALVLFLLASMMVVLVAQPAMAAPNPTSVSPSAAANSGVVHLTISGDGFVTGPPSSSVLLRKAGESDILGLGVVVASSSSMSANFDLQGVAPGLWTVRVTNPDSSVGSCDCFTVTASPPTVTEVSPSSRGQGATNQDLTITGTNFANSATVSFSGSGITVNSTTFVSTTQLTTNISIASGAATGARDVTVTNTDGQTGTKVGGFTVNAKPTVLAANPNEGNQGDSNTNITITGIGFVNGSSLAVVFSGDGITVNSTTFGSALQVTANISIASDATTGMRNITVINGDAGVGSCSDCFTVNAPAPPPPGPTVTSISPIGASNTGVVSVTIKGEGFVETVIPPSRSHAFLFRDGEPLIEGTNEDVEVVDMGDDKLFASFDLEAAAPGTWGVFVRNPNGGVGECTCTFLVGASAPTVTAVNPAALLRGSSNQNLTVTGTNFAHSAMASFSGSGITVNSTTFVSSTELSVNVSIASNAPAGARNVTVTNPDAQSGTCTGCFTVTAVAVPTVSSASPNYAARGVSSRNVVLSGSGFNPGVDVDFLGTGVTVNSVARNSSTRLTVNISVASDATPGARSIKVTNTDGGTSTCTTCFTVIAFDDVPPGSFGFTEIEKIAAARITGGCAINPARYCPGSNISRGQMAVFLLRAMGHGSPSHLPAYRGIFADVPSSHPFARYIEHLFEHKVTGGCDTSPRRYCPNDRATRGQMSVFLLRAIPGGHGASSHLRAYRGIFADVPSSHPFARFIEHLFDHAVTSGCRVNPRRYCPDSPVTRAQMAIFIVKAFGL